MQVCGYWGSIAFLYAPRLSAIYLSSCFARPPASTPACLYFVRFCQSQVLKLKVDTKKLLLYRLVCLTLRLLINPRQRMVARLCKTADVICSRCARRP